MKAQATPDSMADRLAIDIGPGSSRRPHPLSLVGDVIESLPALWEHGLSALYRRLWVQQGHLFPKSAKPPQALQVSAMLHVPISSTTDLQSLAPTFSCLTPAKR